MSPMTEEEIAALTKEINDLSPEFMIWSDDGYYDACLVLKAKNYVLVKKGKYEYRGSALKDTKKEPALIEFLHVAIKDIIENEARDITNIYHRYIKEAMNITDIARWQTKKAVTKAIYESERANETKVLDAMNEAVRLGVAQGWQEGDKMWLYNTIDGEVQKKAKGELLFFKDGRPQMKPNEILRDVRLFDGNYTKLHYVGRVYKTLEILSSAINMDLITDYTLKSKSEELNNLTQRGLV
jgi:NurA-like 5'-3' nuclease